MTKLQRLTVTPAQICPPHILLTAEQQHYLLRVLRLGVGDRFIAMDGRQHWWLTQIEVPTAEAHTARILEPLTIQTELPIAVTLLAALPKGNGFDEVVRQVTELGVSEIIPVLSDRTVLNPSPQKLDRWRRIAQEAAEQSERPVIPTIADPLPFPDALSHSSPSTPRYICITEQPAPHLLNQLRNAEEHGGWGDGEQPSGGTDTDGLISSTAHPLPSTPGEGQRTKDKGQLQPSTAHPLPSTPGEGQRTKDKGQLQPSTPYPLPPTPGEGQRTKDEPHPATLTLMTGPEGGWTQEEIEQAIAAGFQPVSLGKRILRAVTAPVVALGLIAATLERREFD